MKRTITLVTFALLTCGSLSAQEKEKKVVLKEEATKKEIKYRLVIEFISKGGGIDITIMENIENFIKNQPKKPVYEIYQRGREGERSYCLQLKELSKSEQKTFVEEINKLVTKKDMVFVKEHHTESFANHKKLK